MSKNRSQQMVERLRAMQAASPDIEASAIVSVDGLIMASALQADVEEDRVGRPAREPPQVFRRVEHQQVLADEWYQLAERGQHPFAQLVERAVALLDRARGQ